jgi:hypothetical protein
MLFPRNLEKVLSSPYVFNDSKNPRHPECRKVNGRSFASTYLTDNPFFGNLKE